MYISVTTLTNITQLSSLSSLHQSRKKIDHQKNHTSQKSAAFFILLIINTSQPTSPSHQSHLTKNHTSFHHISFTALLNIYSFTKKSLYKKFHTHFITLINQSHGVFANNIIHRASRRLSRLPRIKKYLTHLSYFNSPRISSYFNLSRISMITALLADNSIYENYSKVMNYFACDISPSLRGREKNNEIELSSKILLLKKLKTEGLVSLK
jgi:hypothetical protein